VKSTLDGRPSSWLIEALMSQVMKYAIVGIAGLGVCFAIMYPTLIAWLPRGLGSSYAKADLRRRMYAAIVDGLIAASICVVAFRHQSLWLTVAALVFLLLRDTINGQSPGKLLVGLTVISLDTGQPASLKAVVVRNVVFAIPGMNITAALLETRTLVRDPLGHRLGDRLALTQVVDGLGAKDLAKGFQDFLTTIAAQLGLPAGRRRREPVRDRAASSVVNYKL
jgi:uncharacterized RDD family membrane protein YckC